jgi:hypothetical protein
LQTGYLQGELRSERALYVGRSDEIANGVVKHTTYDVSGRRRHHEFDLALDNVWYGSVALLFKMTVRTDSNQL